MGHYCQQYFGMYVCEHTLHYVYLCPKAGVSLFSVENSATTKILPVSWALEQTLGISLTLPLAVF